MKSSLPRPPSSPYSRFRNPLLFLGAMPLTFQARINQPKLFQHFHKDDNHHQDGYHFESFQVHGASGDELPGLQRRELIVRLAFRGKPRHHLKKPIASARKSGGKTVKG